MNCFFCFCFYRRHSLSIVLTDLSGLEYWLVLAVRACALTPRLGHITAARHAGTVIGGAPSPISDGCARVGETSSDDRRCRLLHS